MIVKQGTLCGVNPTLNIHPDAAPAFLEPSHLAENSDAFAIRTVPDDERRSPCGIT